MTNWNHDLTTAPRWHPTMAERLDAAATKAINNLGLVAD